MEDREETGEWEKYEGKVHGKLVIGETCGINGKDFSINFIVYSTITLAT